MKCKKNTFQSSLQRTQCEKAQFYDLFDESSCRADAETFFSQSFMPFFVD